MRENRLDLVDVDLLGELLLNRCRIARNPDLQFSVQVESSSGFDGEVRDLTVEHAVVLDLLTGKPLLVDHQQPTVREQERIPHQLIRRVNLLAATQ